MNSEQRRLVRREVGDEPWEPCFGGGSNDRSETEFTWNDLVFNLNSFPFDTDTAIVVTSWAGHLKWLRATLASYRRSGKFVILSYDLSQNYIWDRLLDVEEYIHYSLPRPIHHLLAHATVFKHKTYDADKRTAYFWDLKYAQGIINMYPNIKYVYCTNGDCIWEKPEGIDELIKILGDGDLMSGQSQPDKTIHTADILYTRECFNKVVDYMTERMKVPIIGSTSAECLLRDAVTVYQLKETYAPKQPLDKNGDIDFYCGAAPDSTFKDVVGFRNLSAEQEYRENNALEPLPKEYLDDFNNWIYFNSGEQAAICQYYTTGDRRYLFQFWDRGEDSDYNRLYYPLEFYGSEPILDPNNRGYF
jgi:hypothetical protein